ncbi:hypothetical protein QJS10_CPB14g00208 [Acorus calamus]|uniref:Uncharacterized protein n=1 Tax=Acorus calamus TaxID=4465 RepID=A0AAV9DEU2_ACOCL|nr:hypothetical protein QJS10_CPB14g00208 [Acorus calamus]
MTALPLHLKTRTERIWRHEQALHFPFQHLHHLLHWRTIRQIPLYAPESNHC